MSPHAGAQKIHHEYGAVGLKRVEPHQRFQYFDTGKIATNPAANPRLSRLPPSSVRRLSRNCWKLKSSSGSRANATERIV